MKQFIQLFSLIPYWSQVCGLRDRPACRHFASAQVQINVKYNMSIQTCSSNCSSIFGELNLIHFYVFTQDYVVYKVNSIKA